MGERKTRYNELLGIDNTIRDPDLYQLLVLDRQAFNEAAVDVAYRAQMSKLQRIRSPKHKSFIEFLKGELRRARTTLSNDGRREEYDGELLEERREQLTRILDVVLADGVLQVSEEERICSVAEDVGLLPHETEWILSEELRARGATRGSDIQEIPPTHDRHTRADRSRGPAHQSGSGVFPTEPVRPASQADIDRQIQRRMQSARRRRPKPPLPKRQRPPEEPVTAELVEPGPDPEPITAELVAPPPSQPPGWGQTARPARSTGWGKASVSKNVGVCACCLAPVEEQMLRVGKAERMLDGRLHCTSCTNRLVAGLICGTCYQQIRRTDMKGGQLVIKDGRVRHGRCVP